MAIMNLNDLLLNKIQVLYDIETSLVKALPKMESAATDPDLKNCFGKHLLETENQVERLEKIFTLLETKPKKLKSEAIRGLIEDGKWVIDNIEPEEALDANLARAAQGIEHYEIAEYSSAISWAKDLELEEIETLLKETFLEEKEADELLEDVGSKIQKEIII